MKTHYALMIILATLAIVLIVLGPSLNVGVGYGFLLLVCPLMMLSMVYFMNKHDRR